MTIKKYNVEQYCTDMVEEMILSEKAEYCKAATETQDEHVQPCSRVVDEMVEGSGASSSY